MHCSTAVAVALLFLALAVSTVSSQTFGIGFIAEPPRFYTGYTLAQLADVQTPAFAAQYNSIGLPYLAPFDSDSPVCCLLGVFEGFISFGPNNSYSNFLESFVQEADACAANQMPVNTTFGVPTYVEGPYEGLWISSLTPKEQQALRVTTVPPPLSDECSGTIWEGTVFPGIYVANSAPTPVTPTPTAILPPYIVQPQGPNYPAPTGYSEMYVADVTSSTFTSWYNSNGGILLTGSRSFTHDYCCLIRVADGGFLSYGPEGLFSPLSIGMPPSGVWQCAQSTNNELHILTTSFGGPDNGLVFNTLNTTIVRNFGYFANDTEGWDGCGDGAYPDSLTLYKLN